MLCPAEVFDRSTTVFRIGAERFSGLKLLLLRKLKVVVPIIVLVGYCAAASAQITQQEWQAKAIQKYPDLAAAGSPLNKRFVDAYNARHKTNPQFFNDPRWPLLLADELAGSSGSTISGPIGGTRTPVPSNSQNKPIPQSIPSSASNISGTRSRDTSPNTSSDVGTAAAFFVVLIALIVLSSAYSAQKKAKRRKALLAKYGDPEIVNMIMRRMFWTNQTQEQLLDSLGRPVDIDQKVLKTKVKETWKYRQIGRNRFGLRITVEDGLVVGWDNKD